MNVAQVANTKFPLTLSINIVGALKKAHQGIGIGFESISIVGLPQKDII